MNLIIKISLLNENLNKKLKNKNCNLSSRFFCNILFTKYIFMEDKNVYAK